MGCQNCNLVCGRCGKCREHGHVPDGDKIICTYDGGVSTLGGGED